MRLNSYLEYHLIKLWWRPQETQSSLGVLLFNLIPDRASQVRGHKLIGTPEFSNSGDLVGIRGGNQGMVCVHLHTDLAKTLLNLLLRSIVGPVPENAQGKDPIYRTTGNLPLLQQVLQCLHTASLLLL